MEWTDRSNSGSMVRMTNFRAQVQMKGTGSVEQNNKDGSVSLSVRTANLNYLLNGASPHLLDEDGLRPYPSAAARELVFVDGSRLDVLLLDRDNTIVIVECKQGAPTLANIQQLRGYMRTAEKLSTGLKVGRNIRGILVHGGARKLKADARDESLNSPKIELVTFTVNVGFAPSS
jgi:RecB family endonuclease NucS